MSMAFVIYDTSIPIFWKPKLFNKSVYSRERLNWVFIDGILQLKKLVKEPTPLLQFLLPYIAFEVGTP